MTERAHPFSDSSSFADLTWVATNDLTLPPDAITAFFDSGAATKFLEAPAGCRYIVQATRPPGRVTSETEEESDKPVAMAIFTLRSASTDPTILGRNAVTAVYRGEGRVRKYNLL